MQPSGYMGTMAHSIMVGFDCRDVEPGRRSMRRSFDALSLHMVAYVDEAMREIGAGRLTVQIHRVIGYASDQRH